MKINIPFVPTYDFESLIKFSLLYFDKTSVIYINLIDYTSKEEYADKMYHMIFKSYEINNIISSRLLDIDIKQFRSYYDFFKSNYYAKEYIQPVEKMLFLMNHGGYIDLHFYNYLNFFIVNYLIFNNENCLSTNYNTDKFFKSYYRKTNEKKNRTEINSSTIFLPDVDNMNFEDILIIRQEANDELQELRYCIDNLSEIPFDDLESNRIKSHLENKICSAVEKLKRKISGLKNKTIQQFIHNFEDSKTYTPLITTFFTNISAHISFEYNKNLNEIKNRTPLYFSLK